ncbi:MAG: acyltransferase [Candidatus Bathyarchaeia archaeon]
MSETAPAYYLSPRASIGQGVLLEGYNVILGSTTIGENSIIGYQTIIGFPTKGKLSLIDKTAKKPSKPAFSQYDEISEGATIHANCVLRSFNVIYEGVKLGRRVETGHNVMIREGAVIGDGTMIGSGSLIEGGGVEIGVGVSIQSAVFISAPIMIGDNVFIGPRACFINDKYPQSKVRRKTVVEDGAVIGANAIIGAGVKIGEEAVVAAGSVVTKTVPPRVVVKGIPARRYMTRRQFETKKREYEKLSI